MPIVCIHGNFCISSNIQIFYGDRYSMGTKLNIDSLHSVQWKYRDTCFIDLQVRPVIQHTIAGYLFVIHNLKEWLGRNRLMPILYMYIYFDCLWLNVQRQIMIFLEGDSHNSLFYISSWYIGGRFVDIECIIQIYLKGTWLIAVEKWKKN